MTRVLHHHLSSFRWTAHNLRRKRPLHVRTTREWSRAVAGGAGAGVVAGLVDVVVLAASAFLHGADLWRVLKIAAFPIAGLRVLAPGFDFAVVTLGLLLHLLVSASWGALFGVLVFRASRPFTVFAGMMYGLLVLLAMVGFVLPLAGASVLAANLDAGTAITSHLLFGFVLGIAFLGVQQPAPDLLERELRAV